ncbi:heterokaryon incompatibility protein-domain-containing protein [Apiosordaria backusii]|uniref:Heterokaryon incompatibility protein-domain-containing protein n=1 Tax=Apiosordaria backusii TaxID=314023 RepID=A0AA40B742_9PEZI|nr:heterokaryon incompatibility protein-domain-containing protein [Apiosordaria backusii]
MAIDYTRCPLQGPNSIRLLRLLPAENEYDDIECKLVEYPLRNSRGHGQHHYEALSYVWGDPTQSCSITVDGEPARVGANLHAALLHLRDFFFERIIWVDAICINQNNDMEKGEQVQKMAEIYSKANRVVVWLGEAHHDSDSALEEIRCAAAQGRQEAVIRDDNDASEEIRSGSEAGDEALSRKLLDLLRRPWFERIWVLQEVAAARSILIKCGVFEMDGFAFYLGLEALQSICSLQETFGRMRPVTHLMRGAAFRASLTPLEISGRFSLSIHPLGSLIDMYRLQQATDHRDKIFALLGMCSDAHIGEGLLPDYTISLERLLRNLMEYLFGKQATLTIVAERELMVLETRGLMLGRVSSVRSTDGHGNGQQISIAWSGGRIDEIRVTDMVIPPSSTVVEPGDWLCLMEGARGPSIFRLRGDHFVIVTSVALDKLELPSELATRDLQFPHKFLAVWNWGYTNMTTQQTFETLDDALGEGLVHSSGHDRLPNTLQILAAAKPAATEELIKLKSCYSKKFSEEGFQTLAVKTALGQTWQRERFWSEAEAEFREVARTRASMQGSGHPDTVRSRTELLALYKDELNDITNEDSNQGFKRSDNLGENTLRMEMLAEAMAILQPSAAYSVLTEQKLLEIIRMRSHQDQSMLLMVDFDSTHQYSAHILSLALEQRGDECLVTESLLIAAAEMRRPDMLELLFDYGDDGLKNVTSDLMVEAAKDRKIFQLLLRRQDLKLNITEKVLVTATEHLETEVFETLFGGDLSFDGLSEASTFSSSFSARQIAASISFAADIRYERVREGSSDETGTSTLTFPALRITAPILIAAEAKYREKRLRKQDSDRTRSGVAIVEMVIAKGFAQVMKSFQHMLRILYEWRYEEVVEAVQGLGTGDLDQQTRLIQFLCKAGDRHWNKLCACTHIHEGTANTQAKE